MDMEKFDCDCDFDRELEIVLKFPVKPFILKTKKNGNISVILVHEPNQGAYKLGKSQYDCNTCGDRVRRFHNISGQDGQLLFPVEVLKNFPTMHVCHKISEMTKNTCKGPIQKMTVLQGDSVYLLPRYVGHDDAKKPYSHWYLPLSAEYQSDLSVTANFAELCEKAFHRYIISGLFSNLLSRLNSQGVTSLNLMEICLKKVNYGDRFLPAVGWLKSILDDIKTRGFVYDHLSHAQKLIFQAQHLLNAGITKDGVSQDAVCLLFQTATGNIVDLLESANSEKEMMRMCEERLSPEKYQRRTTDASEGQISMAIKQLGDFKNRVMLISELLEIIPETIVHHDSTDQVISSMDGFHAQLKKLNEKVQHKSFSDRCNSDSLSIQIKKLTTVTEFVALTREHPEISVEIECSKKSVVYLAVTTLDMEKLQPATKRHLWAFMNSKRPYHIGLNEEYTRVGHTVPMYEYTYPYKNVLFVTPDAKMTFTDNCCFPEFLDTSIRRICGTAFEGLNKTMPLSIPSKPEPLVLGLGISASTEGNRLMNPVNLLINGIKVLLTHI